MAVDWTTVEFHVGDRVMLVDDTAIDFNKGLCNGNTGTVIYVFPDPDEDVGVEWDHDFGGHDCGGGGEFGHCWWTAKAGLKIINEQQQDVIPASTDELFEFLGI